MLLTWTGARDAVMRRDWPGGVPVRDILAKLNRLPGPPILLAHVSPRASKMGLRRPQGHQGAPRGQGNPNEGAPIAAPLDWEPTETTAEVIAEWARDRGMTGRVTLSAINERRRELGLPEFKLLRRAA